MQTEYEWGNLSRGYDEDGEPVGISPETAMVVMARLRADPRECMAEARRMLSNMPAEVFDAPVTLFVLGDNTFKVLDGNHRIASLFTTGLQDKIMIEAWIGRSCQTA